MAVDPQLLLVLIALRLRGGQTVPIADEPFKTLKKLVAQAKAEGLVAERQAEISVVGKTGKVTKKKAAVLDLTQQGETALQHGASPEMRAVVANQQKAALIHQLDADRAALRQEISAAAKAKPKNADPTKLLSDLTKSVTQLAERMGKLETALAAGNDNALLARIDAAFAALRQKIEAATSSAAAPAAVSTPVQPGQKPLTEALRQAYRTLRQFHEFSDGLVPIPRLYHEARRTVPTLSVEALHRELQTLWDRRELELKILNEVRQATEPDKAIHRGDNLYYYVYWPSP